MKCSKVSLWFFRVQHKTYNGANTAEEMWWLSAYVKTSRIFIPMIYFVCPCSLYWKMTNARERKSVQYNGKWFSPFSLHIISLAVPTIKWNEQKNTFPRSSKIISYIICLYPFWLYAFCLQAVFVIHMCDSCVHEIGSFDSRKCVYLQWNVFRSEYL